MKTEHFDGIIEAAGTRIGSEAYGVLAEAFGIFPEANARRLAAAWNLCKGIDTETLESLGVSGLQAMVLTLPKTLSGTLPTPSKPSRRAVKTGD
jgi:hypothetical protein